MEANVLMAFGLGLFMVFLFGRVMTAPFKLVAKLLFNAVIGALVLWVFNFFGAYFDFHIPLNPVTALIVGFLGVPGTVLLAVIQQIVIG